MTGIRPERASSLLALKIGGRRYRGQEMPLSVWQEMQMAWLLVAENGP